jgi:hypothetical protein
MGKFERELFNDIVDDLIRVVITEKMGLDVPTREEDIGQILRNLGKARDREGRALMDALVEMVEAIEDEADLYYAGAGAGTPERGARRALGATGGHDVMARVLLGTREAAGSALQPVYDILRDYIDRALGRLKREGLTVGIEDSELDLVVYVHGVEADSPRQAGELVFNQLKRDGAMVVAEVQPQI